MLYLCGNLQTLFILHFVLADQPNKRETWNVSNSSQNMSPFLRFWKERYFFMSYIWFNCNFQLQSQQPTVYIFINVKKCMRFQRVSLSGLTQRFPKNVQILAVSKFYNIDNNLISWLNIDILNAEKEHRATQKMWLTGQVTNSGVASVTVGQCLL